ncbi:hypothetical protein [Plasmodium yoelii yoelii]|uniref:Uncharacterized protein n=1 Tax=Plasmodium yoelii yoelii TaxID=73239 RepID=Q7RBP5_PLAYO|nr:hypothetical protein [Plasmodium yoelii yoelii]
MKDSFIDVFLYFIGENYLLQF